MFKNKIDGIGDIMAVKNFHFTPEFYDLQVCWPERLKKEKNFLTGIIKKRNIKSILDVGCGTAHHAQLFSSYVENITAIDPSSKMIKYARKNIIKSSNVTLKIGGFENLNSLVSGQYDLVVCLGNILPILGSRKKVKLALKSTRKKLLKNGMAIFQFLNFTPSIIKKEKFYKPKIINKDGKIYIITKHFEYGKLKTRVDFLTTVISDSGNLEDFYVNTYFVCTLRDKIFLKMASNCGFKKIELMGTGGREVFNRKKHVSLYALLYR
jgi:SAM-dependent methyltransferase